MLRPSCVDYSYILLWYNISSYILRVTERSRHSHTRKSKMDIVSQYFKDSKNNMKVFLSVIVHKYFVENPRYLQNRQYSILSYYWIGLIELH